MQDGAIELVEPLEDVVALLLEVPLKCEFLLLDVLRIQQRDGGELKGVVRAAVEEGAGLRERGDEVLGADDPADAEAGETPVLI